MEAATYSQLVPVLGIVATVIIVSLGVAVYHLRRNLDRRDVMVAMLKEHKAEMKQAQQEAEESYARKLRKLLERSQKEMTEKADYYEKELRGEKEKSRRYLADRKSSEVRTGHILEKVAPLFEDFPGDIIEDNVIPVFKTFDYLVIKDDEIILVEVKSGNAGLSTRQKKVKKLVEAGKVSFRTFRKRGTNGDSDGRKKDQEDPGGQV